VGRPALFLIEPSDRLFSNLSCQSAGGMFLVTVIFLGEFGSTYSALSPTFPSSCIFPVEQQKFFPPSLPLFFPMAEEGASEESTSDPAHGTPDFFFHLPPGLHSQAVWRLAKDPPSLRIDCQSSRRFSGVRPPCFSSPFLQC